MGAWSDSKSSGRSGSEVWVGGPGLVPRPVAGPVLRSGLGVWSGTKSGSRSGFEVWVGGPGLVPCLVAGPVLRS